LVTFTIGLAAWGAMGLMTGMHPAYGGPDPMRVLLVMLVLTGACGLFSFIVMIDWWRTRRALRAIYAIPALGFVVHVISHVMSRT
jgi:hypothetical protein